MKNYLSLVGLALILITSVLGILYYFKTPVMEWEEKVVDTVERAMSKRFKCSGLKLWRYKLYGSCEEVY